jgi:hypothetical protein
MSMLADVTLVDPNDVFEAPTALLFEAAMSAIKV